MKKTFLIIVNLLVFNAIAYCCDTTKLDKSAWQLLYVDSQELTGEGADNGHAIHCFDNDSTTFWHTQWQDATSSYPHEIWIDLGDTFAINGFGFLTRAGNKNGRLLDFEFYVSNDTTDWGAPQSMGSLVYPAPNSSEQQYAQAFFGAVRGRYVRLVGLNALDNNNHVMCAELDVYADTVCAPTGQNNQVIYVDPIPRQLSTNPPITVHAHASSSLPLLYEVVSGPAVAADSVLTLTGQGGMVQVRISQPGDSSYYPIEDFISFEVINLNDYYPVVTPKFTATYPIEMSRPMPYLLHASTSIDESEYLSVSSVRYVVDGATVEATNVNGDFQYWWTPSGMGTHEIQVIATGSNGNATTESVLVEVVEQAQSQVVLTLDSAVIDYGSIGSQWYYGTYELPQFVDVYSQINATLYVSCPPVSGGCDDWDRLAWIQVKNPQGQWVEIIRYITPYGKGCTHHLDVTDFASLLQGRVEMRMYIETWGTGGWQMDLEFEYVAGAPEYPYSHVEEVWQGTYNFGDPANLQPVDTAVVGIFDDVQATKLRLVTTGHGWGDNNTGNAAEFYHAVHHLQVNGEDTYTQDLWTDCYPNPDGCQPQSGTYKYDRAGWCPGVIAQPYVYDISDQLWRTPFALSYIFQPTYWDQCHPHNPDCVSGQTCQDCNAGYNPHYRVSCYLIRFSNNPLEDEVGIPNRPMHNASQIIDFELYPNPCHGKFRMKVKENVSNLTCAILDMDGKTLRTYYFSDEEEANAYLFDLSSLSQGTYFVQIYTTKGANAHKLILQKK